MISTHTDALAQIYGALLAGGFTVDDCQRVIPMETLIYHLRQGKSPEWICEVLYGLPVGSEPHPVSVVPAPLGREVSQ